MQILALVLPSLGDSCSLEVSFGRFKGLESSIMAEKVGIFLGHWLPEETLVTTCNKEYTPYENSMEKTNGWSRPSIRKINNL